MGRSMLKFFNDRGGDEHGGLLHWPGTLEGLPFIGNAIPDLKRKEMEELDIRSDFHSRMFEMWKSDDKALFDKIHDRVTVGWYEIKKRDDRWNEEHQHYRIWLEWVQHYGVAPNGTKYEEF